MKNKVLAGLAIGLFMFTTVVQADNEATYNAATGLLNIPKVTVGSKYYQVDMQQQSGLNFSVTSVTPIDLQQSTYSGVGSDEQGAGSSEYTYDLNLTIGEKSVSGTLTIIEGDDNLGTYDLQNGSVSDLENNDVINFSVTDNDGYMYNFSLLSIEDGNTLQGGVTELRNKPYEFGVSGFTNVTFNKN